MREHMSTETDLVTVEQKKAPAFQPRGQRLEHLLCNVFEGSSTDEELP